MSDTSNLKKKDPDSTVDFGIDWTDYLASNQDTIESSTWEVPAGLTEEDDSHTNDHTFVWLSGGTVGSTYAVTNRIETAGGRTEDETIYILIEER
jgi:hypothetical protein